MKIQLTIDLPKITPRKRTYTTAQEAVGLEIAEQAAQHLLDTFNDDESLGTITYEVLKSPPRKIAPNLKRRVIAELTEWSEECQEILGNVTGEEESESYDARITRINALIREVYKS